MDPLAPDLPGYRLERLIGEGGMGFVYRAVHEGLGRTVAIKVLHTRLLGDRVAVERMRREAIVASSLAHPNIVSTFALEELPACPPFLVMEYVEGDNLGRVLEREAPLAPPRACRITIDLLDALATVHAHGIVHRDLKPTNILLSEGGTGEAARVVDFGIAAFLEGELQPDLTPSGRIMATQHYVSPEQLRRRLAPDPGLDLYALGVILYEMLTGHPPFHGLSFAELCRAILEQKPPPFSVFVRGVPPDLEAIVKRSLEKNPGARYPDALSMREALLAHLGAGSSD